MNICKHCGNECKNKFCNNSCSAIFNNSRRAPRTVESKKKTSESLTGRTVSEDTKLKISEALAGRLNTWATPHSSETKLKISEALAGRKRSEETIRKMRIIARARNFGGHTSKRKLHFIKKTGEVIYLQSSYEVKFASLLEELNIQWSRPDPLRWVDHNGVDHRYYPDFKVGNVFIDTKNDYLAIKDAPKILAVIAQNNVDLRIVTKESITTDFVKSLR